MLWIAACATMTEEITLVRHSGPKAGIQAIECSAAYATMTKAATTP